MLDTDVRQDDRRAAGQAVVVTGAAGGIGAAVVRRLAADGWRVVGIDIEPVGHASGPPTNSEPSPVRTLALDVTDAAAVADAAERLRAAGTGIAGLVNAAGVLQDPTSLLADDREEARRMWEVNYFGAQNCVQAFTPALIEAHGGAIVNVTSVNAHRPLPLHTYAPTKAALAAATVLAAGELGWYGIRVNAVAPGFTRTPALQRKIDERTRDVTAITGQSALGRLVEPDEIATAVSFLISDAASAITGVSLPVDAGWLSTSHWLTFGDQIRRERTGEQPQRRQR